MNALSASLPKPTKLGETYMNMLISVEINPGNFRWLPIPTFEGLEYFDYGIPWVSINLGNGKYTWLPQPLRSGDTIIAYGYNWTSIISPNGKLIWVKYIITPNPQMPIFTPYHPGGYGDPGLVGSLVAAAEASATMPRPKPTLSASAAEFVPREAAVTTAAKPSIQYKVKYVKDENSKKMLEKKGTTFVPIKVLPLPNGKSSGGRRRNKTKRNRISNKK